MTQYLYIIANADGSKSLDLAKVRGAIQTMPWIIDWIENTDESSDYIFECRLDAGPDWHPVSVNVNKSLKSIVIGAYCDRGLEAAHWLQENYDDELFAFSEESLPTIVRLTESRGIRYLEQQLHLRD